MYTEKRSVLETCSNNTAVALRLYCEFINSSEADVFVVMAQKAVCLFQVLLEEGLIDKKVSGKFFSSSVLEFDFADFEGKKVTIVDDIVVSGSAIATVAYKLITFGKIKEDKLEIIALARDIDHQSMQFTRIGDGRNLLKCVLDTKDAQCIEISYEISHILAHRGRPYNADFPMYEKIRMNKDIYNSIMNFLDWDMYDITNDVQNDGNIQAITMFPKNEVQNEIWKVLGIDLSNFVHLKMRIYIQFYEYGNNVLEIVPMALFHETSEENIDTIIDCLNSNSISIMEKIKDFSYSSKLRLLQFFVAHAVGVVFTSKIKSVQCKLSYDTIYLTFGSQKANSILQGLDQLHVKENAHVVSIQKDKLKVCDMGYKKRFKCKTLLENGDDNGYTINQALYQALQYRYEKRELVARDKLKYPTKHFLLDYESIVDKLKRLQEGYSLNALKTIIKDAGRFYKLDQLVSLFIDRGVDEGIVVPTIYYNDEEHYICRAYRHGEDFPFGDADKSRLIYFLCCLDEELKKRTGNTEEIIASIPFEKMLVLFYQMGMKEKQRIFNRFLGFDNDPVLQQRFSVHGVITAIKAENPDIDIKSENHIYMDGSEKHTYMVTRAFKEGRLKYLEPIDKIDKIDKNQTGYIIRRKNIDNYLKNSRLNNISTDVKRVIERIASLIGSWYWLEHNKEKNSFKDNITILTSCSNIYTYSSSVATAIHFYKLYWDGEAKKKLKSIKQGNCDNDFYSKEFDQVLPSARNKFEWYKSNSVIDVINDVKKMFYDNGMENKGEAWSDYWSDILNGTIMRGDNLKEYYETATQYMYFYSVCYDWLRQKWFLQENNQVPYCSQFEKAAEYFQKCNDIGNSNVIEFFKLFDSVLDNEILSNRIDELIERMQEIVKSSETVVEKIENGLSENSATYRVSYTSVLLIDLSSTDNVYANDFFRTVWNNIVEDREKTCMNIIALGSVEEGYSRYGIFHEHRTEQAIQSLLDVYRQIHCLACRYAYKTRAIFIPALRDEWVFKHDLKINISKYAASFVQNTASLIENIRFAEYVHQLIFIRTWTTSLCIYDRVKKSLEEYKELEDKQSIYLEDLEAKFDCYQFVCGEPIDQVEKLEYSTVSINIEENLEGTGILFCYEKEIYCVTCQHLYDGVDPLKEITAIMTYDQQKIKLRPLNYVEKQNRVSWEEILVLKPEIDRSPELDRTYMFNEHDCMEYIWSQPERGDFELYGFGKSDPEFGRRAMGLKPYGRVSKKYYQMYSQQELGPGDSGAAIISQSTRQLFGIHAKSTEGSSSSSLAIPSKTVLDVLSRVYKNEKI